MGRVFTSGEPEMSNHVQRYDQHVYLRAAEAQVRGLVAVGRRHCCPCRSSSWSVQLERAARRAQSPLALPQSDPQRLSSTPALLLLAALPRALDALHAAVQQPAAQRRLPGRV